MSKNISRHGFGAGLLLMLATCWGSQAAAGAGEAVSLKGSYSGFAVLEEDFSGAHCMGSGIFSHLGLVSTQCDAIFLDYLPMEECTGIGEGLGIPNINSIVITAANGDKLALVSLDIACEVTPHTHFVGTGNWTVDSAASTGRFAGATGAGAFSGEVDFAAGVFHCEIEGTISY